MFERLREKYPAADIHVLMFAKNREFLEILELVPANNILTVRGDSIADMTKDSINVLKKMRSVGIDTVIDCELFSRISSIYSFLSGAARRVGFHPHTQEGLYRGGFINRPVLYNPYQHISGQFVTMAEAIDSQGVPGVKRTVNENLAEIPRIPLSDEDIAPFKARLEEDFPGILKKKLVLIYPSGGLLPIRAWPAESYCQTAEDLIRKGYAVGIIGMQDDKQLARRIITFCQSDDCFDLTGYTRSVREVIELFHLAALLITNDGGPGHFASLTPLPTIIFYGPETPALYGPLDPKATIMYNPLSCSPCLTAYNHRNSPCDGNNVCLKSISIEEVLEQAYSVLNSEC
jgi:ADP-heptose:LPS heptosyltransferase